VDVFDADDQLVSRAGMWLLPQNARAQRLDTRRFRLTIVVACIGAGAAIVAVVAAIIAAVEGYLALR
jgi:hypothetical protein